MFHKNLLKKRYTIPLNPNLSNTKDDEHELDELLRYIDEHEDELRQLEKAQRKMLPYWVCTF